MNSEAAGTEWIRKADALINEWLERAERSERNQADVYRLCAAELSEARPVQPCPRCKGVKRIKGDNGLGSRKCPECSGTEARLVPQPATEPTILANLTKHEFERLSHGRIPYSGAAGDPHYDKDPRPWGKHAPYIATYLGELIPAVKAMKWTHFSVKHEHGQWLALRDTQPATEPRITAQEYWPIWVEEKHSEIAGFVAYDRAKAIEFAEDYVAALALRDVPQGQTDEQLVIDLARELYDRFLMGGWTPEDAYPQIRAMLAARQVPVSSEKEK